MRGRSAISNESGRDLVVLLFCLAMMLGLYRGMRWALARLNDDPNLLFLPPGIPLALILLALSAMILFSGIANAMSALFLSEDLDLILASPLTPFRFFIGKFLTIALHTTWMPLVFILPMLLAFGQQYHQGGSSEGWVFVCAMFPLLVSTFSAVVLGAMEIGLLVILLIPPQRAKLLILGSAVLAVAALFFLMNLVHGSFAESSDTTQIFRTMEMLSLAHLPWMPSSWLAVVGEELLTGTGRSVAPELEVLLSTPLFLGALVFLSLRFFHRYAYSRARTLRTSLLYRGAERNQLRLKLATCVHRPHGAVAIKEYRGMVRTVPTLVQLLMLLGLILLYVINMKLFVSLDAFSEATRFFWTRLFFIINFCLGAFVVTSLCVRLVFPSVSTEGRTFWLLQSAPLPLEEFLRAKFYFWYLPASLLGLVVLVAGSLAIGANTAITLFNGYAGLTLSYSLVGLAMGFGTRYAQLGTEDPSQLAASFGSLAFMVTGSAVILLNLIPLYLLLFIPSPYENLGFPEVVAMIMWVLPIGFLLASGNMWIGQRAVTWGARGLERSIR